MSFLQSRPILPNSQLTKQKPVEWIASLIQRYQDQLPSRTGRQMDAECRQLLYKSHNCIINVSKHHLHLVLQALLRVLKAVNASRWTSEAALIQSRAIVLQTLLECLKDAETPSGRSVERECCMKSILEEINDLIDNESEVSEKARQIAGRIGAMHPSLILSRLSRVLDTLGNEDSEEQSQIAISQLSVIAVVPFDLDYITKIFKKINEFWPIRKEYIESICGVLSGIIWRWIERCPEQFSSLQHDSQPQLSEACDKLFVNLNGAELRKRGHCWPLQMLLISISPCSLEKISHIDSDLANFPQELILKRQFMDSISCCIQSCVSASRSSWSSQMQFACHAAVNLCKCATYVNLSDFFIFNVVQQLIENVKVILLTGSRPREIARSVLVDCFVALFRLKFDNDVFRVCLASPQTVLQLVLIDALYIISTQPRLHWWPKIDMVMSRSEQIRTLLMNVLEKVLESDSSSPGSTQGSISTSRSWHKMSGKWRIERSSLASTNIDVCSHETILIAMLKLITIQPTLLIRQRVGDEEDCMEGMVSCLVLLIDHSLLQNYCMQALLALHTVIPQWNSQSAEKAMRTFLSVSSHMLFSVCQKLIHFQLINAENILCWLKSITELRIKYLQENTNLITKQMIEGITTQSLIKLETLCFFYLWSCYSDMVLSCFALFGLNSIQMSIISPSFDAQLSQELSSPQKIHTTGRVALQKSVNKRLRVLTKSNAAVHEAWQETYRIWDLFTSHITSSYRDHSDIVEHVTRIMNTSTTEFCVDVWANMSGFLCSISHLLFSTEEHHVTKFITRLLTVLRLNTIEHHEMICKTVKELISFEIDPNLDNFLIHIISINLSTYSSDGLFVEHMLYILTNMLNKRSAVALKHENTTYIITALLSYGEQAQSQSDEHFTSFIRKFSNLLCLVVNNGGAQKIGNAMQIRILEYFANAFPILLTTSNSLARYEAIYQVLRALTRIFSLITIPLISKLFNRLYSSIVDVQTVLENSAELLKTSKSDFDSTDDQRVKEARLQSLAQLVSCNIETGISKLTENCWKSEIGRRSFFLETLSHVIKSRNSSSNQGSELNSQQNEFLRLITLITDDGSLPVVNCLISALPNEYMDRLSRLLVIVFSEKHMLNELLYTVLWQEAEGALTPSTLFRGSSFASKVIGYCFKVFGHNYLLTTLRPLLQLMHLTPEKSYEIIQERVSEHATVESGIEATMHSAELAFSLIFGSEENFPTSLRTVCHTVYHVINYRFPNSGLSALGKILFLRLFNPAIVSAYEMQITIRRPTREMQRGLTLVGKILQASVNRPTFPKESAMSCFAELISRHSMAVYNFLTSIAVNESTVAIKELKTIIPSVNLPVLYTIHRLFSYDRSEIIRQLKNNSAHPNLCSRIDVLLHSICDEIPTLPAPSDIHDPSLPYFYKIDGGKTPVYAMIMRRIVNAEMESASKLIDEKCCKERWICLLDALFTNSSTNPLKYFSTSALANLDKLIIIFCSSSLFSIINGNRVILSNTKIELVTEYPSFIRSDALPLLSTSLINATPFFTASAVLVTSVDIPIVVNIIDNLLAIKQQRSWNGASAALVDYYFCANFEQLELIDSRVLTLVYGETLISLCLDKARCILEYIGQIRSRNSEDSHKEITNSNQINYYEITTLALVNVCERGIAVRIAAYHLLTAVCSALNFPISSRLQEAPCIYIPTNSRRFLSTLLTSLISHQPILLFHLLPKVAQCNRTTIISCLKDSWSELSRLDDEHIHEILSLMINYTASLNASNDVWLNSVWPVIGKNDRILPLLLEDILSSTQPLSVLLDMIQSVNMKNSKFSCLIVQKLMQELISTNRKRLCRLIIMLFFLSFDSASIHLESQMPNIMHIVTCLATDESLFIRCSVFAIVSNAIHGISSSYEITEDLRRSLTLFLRQLNSEETMRLFNVAEVENGQELVNAVLNMKSIENADRLARESSENELNITDDDQKMHTSLSNIHQLLILLIAMITDLERGLECGREWFNEWRKIARKHAFAPSNIQIRSLVAFSCLATSISEQEIKTVVSVLVQVVKRRESLSSISAVTLALTRLHTLTPSNSPIHRLIFWIVILLFQLEHAAIYEYAVQLLHTNLTHLEQMGIFEHSKLEKIAMDARTHLEWDLKALDQYTGLSFRTNFHFALVGYLLKGLRQPFLSSRVVQLLHLILRLHSSLHNPYALSLESLPYLLALLPFDQKVQQRFRLKSIPDQEMSRFLTHSPWSLETLQHTKISKNADVRSNDNQWTEEEEGISVLLDPEIIHGEQIQSLTVTVLAILARSCPNVHLVLEYLLEAANVFPTFVPVIECLLDQKIVGLVQSCNSARTLGTVVRLIETSASEEFAGGTSQQICSFLQQCGFSGLWRYAGSFLSPRGSHQAINANFCSCLECVLASL